MKNSKKHQKITFDEESTKASLFCFLKRIKVSPRNLLDILEKMDITNVSNISKEKRINLFYFNSMDRTPAISFHFLDDDTNNIAHIPLQRITINKEHLQETFAIIASESSSIFDFFTGKQYKVKHIFCHKKIQEGSFLKEGIVRYHPIKTEFSWELSFYKDMDVVEKISGSFSCTADLITEEKLQSIYNTIFNIANTDSSQKIASAIIVGLDLQIEKLTFINKLEVIKEKDKSDYFAIIQGIRTFKK